MSTHSAFITAVLAFSDTLSHIPQDDLPTRAAEGARDMLVLLRDELTQSDTPIHPEEQLFPGQSDLSWGFVMLWKRQWDHANAEKAMYITTYLTDDEIGSDEEEEMLNMAAQFDFERDTYVVSHMVQLLGEIHAPLPDGLRDYLGPTSGRSIESL
jgi:hypothetical protein